MPNQSRTSFLKAFETLEPRRFLAAGGLDPSFANGGRRATTLVIPTNREPLLATQPDGGIITVVGEVVARFTAAGEPDAKFGVAGRVTDPALDDASTLALQRDGKPLVGSALFPQDNDDDPLNTPSPALFFITRYATNGKIDKTFGDRGRVLVTDPDGKAPWSGNTDLLVQGDGNILLRSGNLLRRYRPDGSPDPTFGGGDGIAELPEKFTANEFALAPGDQKIVVAGTTSTTRWGVYPWGEPMDTPTFTEEPAFARFNSDGSLDTTFANQGTRYYDSEDDETPYPPLPSQILLGGDGTIVGTTGIKYWRLTEAGELDPTFGGDGFVDLPDAETHAALASSIALQSDGKLLAAGSALKQPKPTQPFDFDAIVRRYNPDGSPDTTFGNDDTAVVEHRDPGVHENGSRVLLAPDGTILLAARYSKFGEQTKRLMLARLWRDNGPAAQAVAPAVLAEQSTPYRFRVNWRDDEAVDFSSIDNGDIKAIGPDGSVRKAYIVGADATDDSANFVMNFKIAAPGGQWDAADNGTWTIRILSNHVADTDGNLMRGRILATFDVNIPAAQRPLGASRPQAALKDDDDERDGNDDDDGNDAVII